MLGKIHWNKILHQQQAKKTAKSMILGASPKWGDFGGFAWAKNLQQ